jgi:hypothetical protein
MTKKKLLYFHMIYTFLVFTFFYCQKITAQDSIATIKSTSNFWQKVQFGGGLGFNFLTGFTDVFVAPTVIYNINAKVALGAGLTFNYTTAKNDFSTFIYGMNTIVLLNPLPEIQLSLQFNQSRVNYQEMSISTFSDNFWDTSLILGAGYRSGNVTFGMGYNLIDNDRFNRRRFAPFIRAFF